MGAKSEWKKTVSRTLLLLIAAIGIYKLTTSNFQAYDGNIAAVSAQSASAFTDSLGMNVHSYWWTPSQTTTYIGYLRDLNIHYVRDEFAHSYADYTSHNGYGSRWIERLQQFHTQANIGSSLISQELVVSPSDVVNYVKNINQVAGTVYDIEGPNEVDFQCAPNGTEFTGHIWAECPNNLWLRRTEQYAINLNSALKNDPATRSTVIYSPSIIDTHFNVGSTVFRNNADYGNVHYYPYLAGDGPTNIEGWLQRAAALYGPKPIVVTEEGAPNRPPDGQSRPINDQIQAEILPLYYLANFKAGVKKTFLYQLVDDSSAGDLNGIISDQTGQPKLAYTSLKNLTTLLADSTVFTPGSLKVRVTGSNVSWLLLEKHTGQFNLVLWPTALAESPTPLPGQVLPTRNAVVDFGQPIDSVSTYASLQGQQATQVINQPGQVGVSLGNGPIILQIQPTTNSGSSGSSSGSTGSNSGGSTTTKKKTNGNAAPNSGTPSNPNSTPAPKIDGNNGFVLPDTAPPAPLTFWERVAAWLHHSVSVVGLFWVNAWGLLTGGQ